jgi:tetratricopeptide (TPR) repeat protein
VVSSLNNLGSLLMDIGDYDGAAGLLHEGLELTERLGALQTRPYLLNSLAAVVEHTGDLDGAERMWSEADALVREAGDRSLEAQIRIYRARLRGRREGLEAALPGFRGGLKLAWEIRGTPYLLGFLIDLVDLWLDHGHEVEAREALSLVATHPAADTPAIRAANERLERLGPPTEPPPSLDAFMERLLEGGEEG